MKLRVHSYLASLPTARTAQSVAKNLDKTNTLRYFVEGVTAHGDQGAVITDAKWQPADVAVILGWVHENSKQSPHLVLRKQIVDNQAKIGGRTIIADSNLFLYRNLTNPGYWLRYSYDNVFPDTGEYCDAYPDPQRWRSVQASLGVTLQKWRTNGNHILLCLQREGGWSMGGINVVQWAIDTVEELRRHSNRPIRIRSHPGDKRAVKYCHTLHKQLSTKNISGVSFSVNQSLISDLHNCWAVVNHNSSPAVAAAIEGIPIFVTDIPRSQARDIANHNLRDIENPQMPDNRLYWLERISQFHWSHEELRSGQCWNHMRSWAKP